jgi:hypothetical protein
MKARLLRSAVAAALLGSVAVPAAAQTGDTTWDWRVTPYVWAIDVTADYRNRSANVSFSDIMDQREFSFLLQVESQGEQWGFLADFVHLNLGDDRTLRIANARTDLKTTIFDLAAVYSPGPERFMGFEGFAGLRYVSADFAADVVPNSPALPALVLGFDTSFTDFLVGARYSRAVSDQWSIGFRADASFGHTEGTWTLAANATRKLGSGALQIGYRYMGIELRPRNEVLDLSVYGPQLAYTFHF